MKKIQIFLLSLMVLTLVHASDVKVIRVPDGGIQPQTAVSDDGVVHLIYFKDDPMNGNIYYCKKGEGEARFAAPIRVNSQKDSVLAKGTMRGPQIALGKNGRVHVSWMGGPNAPKVSIDGTEETPMMYARLNDKGTAFEPEKNLIQWTGGLDGGGTVAADAQGNVYVAWHGGPPGNKEGEDGRAVYMAFSKDEGKTFSREKKISPADGACGCCGMKAFVDKQNFLWVTYRAANEKVKRPETVMVSKDQGQTFEVLHRDPWNINACPASTTAIASSKEGALAAWETERKVYWTAFSGKNKITPQTTAAQVSQKNPVITANEKGEVLFAWTEGTGWERGGKVGWQKFAANGKPLGTVERAEGLPVWGIAAVWTEKNGDFVVIY